VTLADRFCTGSSIMPQKINPDVLELVRGKTGRVVGNLMSLLVLVKGLPLAYNRDLQEDKERLFDSADTVAGCLDLMAPIVAGAELNREAVGARIEEGYLDATTLMEFLIRQGVPQRTAHETIGRLVAIAMKKNLPLAKLPLEDFQAAHADLGAILLECTNMMPYAVDVRRVTGLPVFSIRSFVCWFQSALAPARFAMPGGYQ